MLSSATLYVKHLPSKLSIPDREELLKIFGAIKVRCLPDDGKMKYTAFATFPNHELAKKALSLLHQRKVLDQILVAEFAREHHQSYIPHESEYQPFKNEPAKETTRVPDKEVLRLDMDDFSRKLHGVAPVLGLDYLPSSLLKYKYPPPTPTIIQNISNALASVPKFYTQVLHLMNKMNLPAPFGPKTPSPPLAPDFSLHIANATIERDSLAMEEMEVTSPEEESEYESETEEGKQDRKLENILPQKRTLPKPKLKPKKQKLTTLRIVNVTNTSRQRTEPSEVFESQLISQKKISVKKIEEIKLVPEATLKQEETGSFGAFDATKPAVSDTDDNKEPEEQWDYSQFITKEELRKKRISSREMKTMSVFRNFSPGEPTFRLYIKNLARQVEEKDLRFIFGRFINRSLESERNMFDIKLMKEGRMKGQAFVTLANEKQAIEAVKETNGYVLHTKPLVVQFARSAKPKEDDTKKQKKI